jgi:hypothetical protein
MVFKAQRQIKNTNDLWKKILRNVFRSVVEDNQRRIRTNIELEKMHKDATLVPFLNSNASDGWDVYKGRGKKQQENILGPNGRTKARRKGDVENEIREMGIGDK